MKGTNHPKTKAPSFAILVGVLLPLGLGVQVFLGGLGLIMLIVGVLVHVLWIQS